MAEALWVEPGRAWLQAAELPAPRADEVVVRATHSGVSRGTEALVFRGGVPASERERMRCPFQGGRFPGPVKYGYASVGVADGERVFCLHPHQDHYVVPRDALVPIPDGVPSARAVLAANCETALNAIWDLGSLPQRLLVIGGGVVGLLTGWLAARQADVQLVDLDPSREGLATSLGMAFAGPDTAWRDVPVVVHASGSEAGLRHALEACAFEGTVLELSWFGDRSVALPLGGPFHARRLTLRASQVGAVSPSRRGRVTHRQRLAEALSRLTDPALDGLLDSTGTFAELPADLARLAASPGPLCHVVTYSEES